MGLIWKKTWNEIFTTLRPHNPNRNQDYMGCKTAIAQWKRCSVNPKNLYKPHSVIYKNPLLILTCKERKACEHGRGPNVPTSNARSMFEDKSEASTKQAKRSNHMNPSTSYHQTIPQRKKHTLQNMKPNAQNRNRTDDLLITSETLIYYTSVNIFFWWWTIERNCTVTTAPSGQLTSIRVLMIIWS